MPTKRRESQMTIEGDETQGESQSQALTGQSWTSVEESQTSRPSKKVKVTSKNDPAAPSALKRRATKSKVVTVAAADLPPRVSSAWKVGAHVSSAGGPENAIINAAKLGANSFALFVKSQRKWSSPSLTAASITAFKERMEEFGYAPRHVLPHGSYLINLGNPDDDKRQKSYDCFLDDLQRCEQLGLELYNFHPGSTVGATTSEISISLITACINKAHKATKYITVVLENMAGAGNIIGSAFTDLAKIIAQVENKKRVGVCLDTCHMFAAGYDIRTKEGWNATMSKFDAQVGLTYLRGMHLNDSKTALGSKKDRHENISLGHLSILAFHHILTDPRTQDLPLILETPSFEVEEVWRKEVEVLNRISMQPEQEGEGKEGEEEGSETLKSLEGELRDVVKAAGGSSKTAAKAGLAKKTAKKRKGKDESDYDSAGDA